MGQAMKTGDFFLQTKTHLIWRNGKAVCGSDTLEVTELRKVKDLLARGCSHRQGEHSQRRLHKCAAETRDSPGYSLSWTTQRPKRPNVNYKLGRPENSLNSEYAFLSTNKGNPHGSVVKEPACNAGDAGSIPGSERSHGEGNGKPLLPIFLPGKFHGQRSLAGYSLWGP